MNPVAGANPQGKKLILLVEDEKKLGRVVVDYIKVAGYSAHWETHGKAAVESAKTMQPALILLDLNLPDMDGLEVCRSIREFSKAPIMMLTARAEEVHRVRGLDVGADDYVCKPFSANELMARVRAVFRRIDWPAGEPYFPGLVMDEETFSAKVNGQPLNLTPVEFRLLHSLLRRPGQVFSRTQLLDFLYTDYRDTTDRVIDSHIRNLRSKLREVLPDKELIRSVYGVGYKFDP